MTGIHKAIDQLQRNIMPIDQPFHRRSGFAADGIDDFGIGISLGFFMNVGGKQFYRVVDSPVALETRATGRDHTR